MRSECPAELAQAHTSRLSQPLDRKFLGNVISCVAKGSGDPIALWRKIDRRGELRLSAMATVVDNQMLGHGFGDGEAVIFLDESQREIDAGSDARRRPNIAVPAEDVVGLDANGGIIALEPGGMSPVGCRSAPVQQPSRRQRECPGADARNAAGPTRSLDYSVQSLSGERRVDPSPDNDQSIEHAVVECCSSRGDAKAAGDSPNAGRHDMDLVGRTSDLAICRLERAGRTSQVEHLKSWRNVEAERIHGRMIGKFDV